MIRRHDQRAEENPCDSVSAFETQFKESIPEGLGVWWTQIRAYRGHSTRQNDVSRGKRATPLALSLIEWLGSVARHQRKVLWIAYGLDG
jgi:hypothetical protein